MSLLAYIEGSPLPAELDADQLADLLARILTLVTARRATQDTVNTSGEGEFSVDNTETSRKAYVFSSQTQGSPSRTEPTNNAAPPPPPPPAYIPGSGSTSAARANNMGGTAILSATQPAATVGLDVPKAAIPHRSRGVGRSNSSNVSSGPSRWYVVTRGREVGVFEGW